MVSKVAVIALVAIVACPILLGYGMNLSEITETTYKDSGVQATDVTGLLENGHTTPSYNFTHSDILNLNSKFYAFGTTETIPYYESVTSNRSSLELNKHTIVNESYTNQQVNTPKTTYDYFFIQFDSPNVGIDLYIDYGGGATYAGYTANVWSIFIEHTSDYDRFTILYDSGGTPVQYAQAFDVPKFLLQGGPANGYLEYHYAAGSGNDNKYADIAAGYHFTETVLSSSSLWPSIETPTFTKQFTMTLNLDSITAANYTLNVNLTPFGVMYVNGGGAPRYAAMAIDKTTVNGVVKWTLINETDASAEVTELYLDPSITDNTYQFTISADQLYDPDTGKYYPLIHITASYVGSWPTAIGIANSYRTYQLDYVLHDNPLLIYNSALTQDDLSFNDIFICADSGARTPIMRIDDALIRAFQYYRTITDRVYDAGSIRENPSTTITDIKIYGASIEFGGYTYEVKDGNIILGTHEYSLDKLVFDSIPTGSGTYYNRINENIISTTAQPSTITFNGTWAAKVLTRSLEVSSYTSTQWTPGQFAWDGIDQNFLMIGLLAAVGVFIALGIAYRKAKAALGALLVVCGGAILLFFTML